MGVADICEALFQNAFVNREFAQQREQKPSRHAEKEKHFTNHCMQKSSLLKMSLSLQPNTRNPHELKSCQ